MKFLEKNVGDMDRALRIALAFVFVGIGIFMLAPPWTYVAFLLGLVMALTVMTKSCAAYTLLGISTMGKKSASRKKAP